jgi:hypothetical protein
MNDDTAGPPADAVAAARTLLVQFRSRLTRPQVALLLRYWRWADALTPEDLKTVLADYPPDATAWMHRSRLEFDVWAGK